MHECYYEIDTIASTSDRFSNKFRIQAYDGFYLAVAERKGAELWTADEKLVNRAKQLNISWIRRIDGN